MAIENVSKNTEYNVCVPAVRSKSKGRRIFWVVIVLRIVALTATATATFVMALNKQTKSFVVATVATTPITATLTAKFQDTPAFVLFVIANAMGSFHNLLMIGVEVFGSKLDYKGLRAVTISIFDMLTVATISGGVNAAVFMAELGKNGNSHANWNQICDKFGTYCDHGAAAIAASFVALLLMLIITIISIIHR
ncbi:CASP-like protein 1B1 [Euphorbia lathyris]|uniref:CASP-like protein 1B1 n=1 Tax=Euphorbia lathyris TaxID=212925 RepID=UPI00331328CC